MDCLKLVPVSALAGDEPVMTVIEHHVSAIAAPDGTTQPAASAMLLDPTRCIRCGLCAARCPTEAVKMEIFRFTEEILFRPETTSPSS
jgi:ferredoxin